MLFRTISKLTQSKSLLLKDPKALTEQLLKEQKKKSNKNYSKKLKRLIMVIKLFHKFKMNEFHRQRPINLTLRNLVKNQYLKLKITQCKWSIINQMSKSPHDNLKKGQTIIPRLISSLFTKEILCKKNWKDEWWENKRYPGVLKRKSFLIGNNSFNFTIADKLMLILKDRLKRFKREILKKSRYQYLRKHL